MSAKIALAALILLIQPAAAELPSRQQSALPEHAKTCELGGKRGFLTADGSTCVTVGGYVSGHAAAGGMH
ncbi:MAG: hypothetical protein ACLPN5_03030 [Roseiarcus sp.]